MNVLLARKVLERCFPLRKRRRVFTLYQHKGLNYSIFKNDSQIAAFSKNSVKIGKGDRYEIQMNDDASLVIVICLALTVNDSENEDDDATVTYDLGNIAEDRQFDRS